MVIPQTHPQRRAVALLRRGDDLIAEKIPQPVRLPPDSAGPGIGDNGGPPLGDPLLSAKVVRQYCGNISEMTLWRWIREIAFPLPDVVLLRKRF